ncbi:MAG: metal ABC transporter ATP-binding protein [Ruminococcaceae bacterium]|nr:metal ABC transporter ATP-binding protein [Oscillospiraceae bacterium]
MTEIRCTELTLGYDSNNVIENLSFSAEHGDFLCILGENGSGKSTLIKGILKLIKPISGKIEFGNPHTSIGYLPQQAELQRDFPASVKEVVMSGCTTPKLRLFSRSAKKTAEKNMALLGISDLAKKSISELSGGQLQKVLLARALSSAATMLLLDEPTSSLDPIAASEMYEIISNLNKNSGVTVIMVSHDIKSALKYATHILHIGNKTTFFGTTEGYLKLPESKTFSSFGGDEDE